MDSEHDWSIIVATPPSQVGYIKSIVYALHRRVKGLLNDDQGAPLPAMTLDQAIADLEGKAQILNGHKKPTTKWIADSAMPKLHKAGEPTPAVYESTILDVNGAQMFRLKSGEWWTGQS